MKNTKSKQRSQRRDRTARSSSRVPGFAGKHTRALKSSDYVHLHNHTQYSLLDGLTKIPQLIKHVKTMGMEAIAVTDHGTMSGIIEFYQAAKKAQINPVVGMEAYISPRKHTDRDVAKDRQYFHLTMLVMNQTGYQNLMKLTTIANLEGFYYKPRLDHDLIEKYNEGLIVLSGCINGEVSEALRQGQYQQAKAIAQWYKGVFGDRYYIELQDHGHPDHPSRFDDQNRVNKQLLKLAAELDIPPVVTCDAHYLKREDQEAHEILLCVQTAAFLDDADRMSLKDFELHVADPKEIIARWADVDPSLITNTKKIANRCNLTIELGKILIPKFPTPKGETEKSLFEKLAWQGMAWRYAKVTYKNAKQLTIAAAKKKLPKEVIERANYEFGVVERMGFSGYFLIVADFINWGKDRGIVFGPGRGSAASSILAYALRITEIEPLTYDLLFERFLNPDRISMPDMDIDIQDDRRDEVINYCIEKYGDERVANIVTFGRMAARNSVRDVARVLRVPYIEADRWAKLIPPPVQGRHTSLTKHIQAVPELRAVRDKNPEAARVFELAGRLEGTIRSHGVHAAGVVIAPDVLTKFVPLELAAKGVTATQYSMWPIEDLGLLKMDFLGLSNLTTIKNALRIIKKVHKKTIDISTIPLDDEKTFRLLQRGETTGVFQLESSGMKRYLKELQPTVFEDIIAMVALYRPGPMQWIDDFIARKHGRKSIEYTHPIMKPALESTYGVIVYQEQVMQISKEMCGFTGGQADTLRKGIGKKIPEVMAKLKNDFIEGAIKTVGADRQLMERFWSQLEEFAAYCFNKVHSACYGLIAYQTAYLKAHYPAAFMAALMTSDYDDTDRLAIEIAECRTIGLEVLPPDVNESYHEFAIVPDKDQIRFGLDAIKNVGHGAAEEILRAREAAGGKFNSLEEFCRQVNPQVVNHKSMESLIRSGALDCFGDRGRSLNNIDNILALASRFSKDASSGQVDLFGDSSTDSPVAKPQINWSEEGPSFSDAERLVWERELLGIYLSKHPLESFAAVLRDKASAIKHIKNEPEGRPVTVGGNVGEIRVITTKNGSKMAFAKLADMTGEVELVLFPKVYQQTAELWERDQVLLVRGKIGQPRAGDDGETKILVDAVSKLSSGLSVGDSAVSANSTLTELPAGRLYIRLKSSDDQSMLVDLKQKLDAYRGKTEVVLVTGPEVAKQAIKLPQTINVSEESIRDLARIFGSTNVIFK